MGFLKKYTKLSPSTSLHQTTSTASTSSTSSTSSASADEQITQHPNTSTSNLSTTSTLIDTPHIHIRPSAADREGAEQRIEAQGVAERSQAWPHDPWRGGFGPTAKAQVRIGGRWVTAKEERREARREVGEWLKGNGFRRG